MIMLKVILSQLWNRFFGVRHKIVEETVRGKLLRVYKGTIRKQPDKDDAWFAHLVMDKQVVFDVGANIGYTALLGNIYGNPKTILLIDPNPLALASAAANMILNDLSSNCRFVAAFVSDKSKEKVKFYTVGRGAAGSMFKSHAKSASKLNSWYWVPTLTLDDVAEEQNMDPDFIKIDVEGAEHLVLRGSGKLAKRKRVHYFVEMHSNTNMSMVQNAELILEWCREYEYKAWYMRDAIQLKDAEQIAHRGKCHLLLLPEGTDYPDSIRNVPQGAALPTN